MADVSAYQVSEFMSITCSSELQARYMLNLFDNHLDTAVDEYLEGNIPPDDEIIGILHSRTPSDADLHMIKKSSSSDPVDIVKQLNSLKFSDDIGKSALDHPDGSPNDDLAANNSLSGAAAEYLKHHSGDVEKASERLLHSVGSDFQARSYLNSCSGNVCVAMHQLLEVHQQMDMKRKDQQLLYTAAQEYLECFRGNLQQAFDLLVDLYRNDEFALNEFSRSDEAAKVKKFKDAGERYLRAAGGDIERAFNMLLEYEPQRSSGSGVDETQVVIDEYLDAFDFDLNLAMNALIDYIQDNRKQKSNDDHHPVCVLLNHFSGDYNAAIKALGEYSPEEDEERPPLVGQRRCVATDNRSADNCPCGNEDPLNLKHYYFTDTQKNEVEFIGFLCKRCDREYVVADVMNEQIVEGLQKELVRMDRELYRNPKKVLKDVESITTKVKVQSIFDLKVGDEFALNRLNVYTHHGIVFNIDVEKKVFEGIHYNKLGRWMKSDAVITKQPFRVEDEDVYVRRYDKNAEDNAKLVVARASSCIGDRAYNAFVNNCEHFATFCKTGISASCQVKNAMDWVKGKITEMITENNLNRGKNFVVKYSFPKANSFILKKSKLVKSGILILIEGKAMIAEISRLNEERNSGDITRIEYLEKMCAEILKSVIEVSIRVGCVLSQEGLGGWFGRLLFPMLGNVGGIGVFVGSILGGKVGSLSETKLGNIIGSGISSFVIPRAITCNDRAVKELGDLNVGDHVVIYATALHPRCHGIVTNQEGIFNEMVLLRNTYEQGVVEETVEFKPPVYRVIYGDGESRDVDETLRRGRGELGTNKYNLLTYNCKHFAEWCKKK